MINLEGSIDYSTVRQCLYCRHGSQTADGENILCIKKGVMLPHSKCRKFKYDPLKREPLLKPQRLEFSKEEFSLK